MDTHPIPIEPKAEFDRILRSCMLLALYNKRLITQAQYEQLLRLRRGR